MRRFTPEQPISAGHVHESKWLGEIKPSDKMAKDIDRVKKPSKNPNFEFWVDFKDAFDLVKKYQPIDPNDPEHKRIDPANPEAPLLRDIKEALIEQMDLTDEQADKLKLYTAVGSPMDVFHGADAIIEYEDKIITVDLTLKEFKEGDKADVVVTGEIPSPDNPDTEQDYLDRVDTIAASIRTIIKTKPKRGYRPIQTLYPPSEAA